MPTFSTFSHTQHDLRLRKGPATLRAFNRRSFHWRILMNATRNQLRCLYGTSRELPTTGLNAHGLALLSMIDSYIETYQRNHNSYPPAISLNQKQLNLLAKSARLAGLELSELTHRGVSFHLIEESPETGRPGNTPQF
jgi:hypothetical protein